MKHITYTTEKMINKIKKKSVYDMTNIEYMVIRVWDDIFASCNYMGATLKELEEEIGHKLSNNFEARVYYFEGIHGLEYTTKGNVHYTGTNDLSDIIVKDFNKFVKEITENV